MNPFDDPIEALIERRRETRRRLMRAVRGWLRSERAPRWTMLLVLLACTTMGLLVDAAMQRFGFDFRPYRWMIATFSTWPLFLLLLRWRADVESRRLNLVGQINHFVRHDEVAEQLECNPTQSKWGKAFGDAWDRESGQAISRELGRSAGGGGIFLVVILLAASAGTWLAWDLIRLSPTLLADTMIDGVLVPAEPELVRKMDNDEWWKSLGSSTCFHFMGLALAGLTLGIFLPPESFWSR